MSVFVNGDESNFDQKNYIKHIKIIKKKEVFGIENFFFDKNYIYNYESLNFSVVLKIT